MKHLKEGLIKQKGVTKIIKPIPGIKDLQDGDIVVLKSGIPYMKYQDVIKVRWYGPAEIFLNEYKDDLTHILYKTNDIEKIYRPNKNFDPAIFRREDVLKRIINNADTKLLFDREN